MNQSSNALVAVGTMFQGRYEILAQLGQGGFGTIYKARQVTTGQAVAVKVLRSLHDHDGPQREARIARFQREMQLSAQIHHPNIVRLVDAGQTESGLIYTVFEFAPGKDLAAVLADEGRLDPLEARHLMLQILDALGAAHAAGIVHRDLKPANIMVIPTGARRNALILDFGIGVLVESVQGDALARITSTQESLGTPAYAAPEQLRGAPPTPKSDLYAWGLVFIECLTGTRVVTGSSVAEIIFKQLSAEPIAIPSEILAHPLGALLERATRKDPARRDVTVERLLADLEAIDMSDLRPKTGPRVPIQQAASDARTETVQAGAIRPSKTGARSTSSDGRSGSGTTHRHMSNLPAQPTKLVGREKDVAAVRALLDRDDVRLVTLTGAGGSGKTRLALEVASAALAAYPDGAFMVQLASVTDHALVIPTIAQALGVREIPGRPLLASIQESLADKRMLLLIDNFEHVVAAAPHVTEILAMCPAVKALVTSRAVLHVRFEREIEVQPLDVPEVAPQTAASALVGCGSVQLFVDRVHDHNPSFRVDDDNAGLVAAICARLDGLPLAIELCAPRLRILKLDALLARLTSRLSVLTGGRRDLAARQQTLRATIDWSYNLLAAEQQRLFGRLAAFSGGASLDDIEIVADDRGDLGLDVLDGVTSLVEQSMLKHEDDDGEVRFRMLETLREHAIERLDESGEGNAVRGRHAGRFLALAERAAPELHGREQASWTKRIQIESDNLRAAMAFSLDRGEREVASRIFQSLLWFWISQGSFFEARGWMDRVLAGSAPLGRVRARAVAASASGFLTVFMAGDYMGALPLFEEARSIFLEVGSKSELGWATIGLGITSGATGRPEGVPLMQEALAISIDAGDKTLSAVCHIALGENARYMGDHPRAGSHYAESVPLLREVGNMFWIGYALQNLAHVKLAAGDWQSACSLLTEALEVANEYQYVMVMNLYLAAMAGVGVARGEHGRAARLLGAVDATLTRIGARFQPPDHNELTRNTSAALAGLGQAAFDAERAVGAAMTIAAAIAEATPLRA